ncbi:MAG: (Fe-S)-binding protein [Candidatus Gastranaerophilaceae bacterium]
MTELSGLQIFKYLPAAKKADHTNCKECGCPTCMAFALNLQNIRPKSKKHIPDELKEIFLKALNNLKNN